MSGKCIPRCVSVVPPESDEVFILSNKAVRPNGTGGHRKVRLLIGTMLATVIISTEI